MKVLTFPGVPSAQLYRGGGEIAAPTPTAGSADEQETFPGDPTPVLRAAQDVHSRALERTEDSLANSLASHACSPPSVRDDWELPTQDIAQHTASPVLALRG